MALRDHRFNRILDFITFPTAPFATYLNNHVSAFPKRDTNSDRQGSMSNLLFGILATSIGIGALILAYLQLRKTRPRAVFEMA